MLVFPQSSLMFSVLLLSALAASGLAKPYDRRVSPADPVSLFKRISSGCSMTGAASCSSSSVSNTCCTEFPGGLLLQPQFWDTNPSTGPSNSWTIHGLWPDNCDGTFSQNCDPSRDYTNIAGLLTSQGASATLDFMQTYWVDINGNDETFWEHEWATHGTCMSTLERSCLPSGSPTGAEAVAFFQTVVRLFQTLPTYQWLSNQGITPSATKTFSLSTLTSAIKAEWGFTPALDCSSGALNSISYYFHLQGSVIDGRFVPINAPKAGSCPSSGIKYPLKSGSPTSTTTSSGGPTSTGPAGSLPTKATITASTTGGLLSAGTWSTQTLATYTLSGSSSSFTLKSSKGNCGVSSGKFSCGSGVSASKFSAVTSGSKLLLAFSGSTAFSSDGTPSGTIQETVFTGSSHSVDYTLAITA